MGCWDWKLSGLEKRWIGFIICLDLRGKLEFVCWVLRRGLFVLGGRISICGVISIEEREFLAVGNFNFNRG